jgi:hypothetical protein
MKPSQPLLIAGDALVIAVLVFVGIRFHGSDASSRLIFTLLPFLLAWMFTSAMLGILQPLPWRHIWRILPAMLLAAPLGAILRAAWLGSPALPIFALIMGTTLAAGLLAWRALFNLLFVRSKR